MIFYCDLQGNLKAFQNETVYQGSNNVTTIYVVAPFSRPVGLNISFTKPNKLVTSPAIMKWVGTLGNVKIPVSFVNIPEQFTDTYNVWAYALPYSITEQNGVVGVSVNAVIADSVDASGQQAYKGNLTTFTGQFTVAYSALPSPPTDIPTEWTQDKVLDLLNNYYNDAIQKIGEMNTLKTDAKDTLVKAINEVFDEIASTNATIGDLSTLTTDEKTTIVGAINEVDAHADANKAEIGDLSALTTDEKATLVGAINEADNHADNATTLANNAVATANGAVATANEAKTTAQTAENNANSAVDTANAANATADEAKAIAQGSQRAIGFATLQAAITALNGYSNTQLKVGDNVYIVETGVPDLWVAAVEQNSVAYNYTTNDAFNDDLVGNTLVQVGYYKFAYLESDGKPCTVAWQNMTVAASDWVASTEFEDFAYEAKIALSDFVNFSSIPQVVFGLTEATSGNYAPICKAGDKGVYIYSKVNTAITLPTVVTFAPNVHGASMQGGGYTNKGKWVASTTYAIDDLVYTDNGQFVCIEGITSTTSPEQDTQHWQATFVATVPEALPQEASALKSGELPISGWGDLSAPLLVSGEKTIGSDFVDIGNIGKNNAALQSGWKVTVTGTINNTYIQGASQSSPRIDIISSTSYFSLALFSNYNQDFGIRIYTDGSVKIFANAAGNYNITIYNTTNVSKTYTISDTSITANSDVLMELTDEGGVKANALANGSITVIRDTVPTQAIPYTYKVKQTNASGQFTLVNHFVPNIPVTSVNGQTGEVTIAVPTKTSQLTNDSGYVSSIPIVRNVVCNDVDSATTLGTTITCEIGDLILAQIIVRSALTLPTGWTLLRTIPAIETTYNQTLSFAYKRATSTSETLTVTQATEGRIYTNLVRLSNAVSISYIQSCEKTNTGAQSISSTKPVTPNMVIWGASSTLWQTSSPYENWSSSPSTLDYYSLPQASRQPRLGTFVDSSGAGERTFTANFISDSSSAMMCGAVEIVGDEVARKSDIPTSVPVTYKKASGSLPTSGWTPTENYFFNGNEWVSSKRYVLLAQNIKFPSPLPTSGWKMTFASESGTVFANIDGSYEQANSTDAYIFVRFRYSSSYSVSCRIYYNGQITAIADDQGVYANKLWNSNIGVQSYTISDTDITANTSVKMYLTDNGGVKAQSKASGSITVIRDTVPTTAIPYEYEVEQTSAEGLFEVINAYVPAVPTKTSQLTNDSGFITAADIPSAGEWVTVTENSATLTEAGTYQVLFGASNSLQSIIYWDGSNGADGIYSTVPTVTSGRPFINCRYPHITADGVLSINYDTITEENGTWTKTTSTLSGFKYRKIN